MQWVLGRTNHGAGNSIRNENRDHRVLVCLGPGVSRYRALHFKLYSLNVWNHTGRFISDGASLVYAKQPHSRDHLVATR